MAAELAQVDALPGFHILQGHQDHRRADKGPTNRIFSGISVTLLFGGEACNLSGPPPTLRLEAVFLVSVELAVVRNHTLSNHQLPEDLVPQLALLEEEVLHGDGGPLPVRFASID